MGPLAIHHLDGYQKVELVKKLGYLRNTAYVQKIDS
jgi:hypothetical protein